MIHFIFTGCFLSGNKAAGTYELVEVFVSGVKVKESHPDFSALEGQYIELKDGGTAVIDLEYFKKEGTYEVEDEYITLIYEK